MHADSTYVIQGITQWIHGWRRRGWRTAEGKPVLNRELWEALAVEVAARGRGGVQWHWVRGHAAVPGNERADEIASGFAAGKPIALYDGSLLDYPIALHELPDDTSVPKRRQPAPRADQAGAGVLVPERRRRRRGSAMPPGRSASGASRRLRREVQESDERRRRRAHPARRWGSRPRCRRRVNAPRPAARCAANSSALAGAPLSHSPHMARLRRATPCAVPGTAVAPGRAGHPPLA